jgi:hypothetical protein
MDIIALAIAIVALIISLVSFGLVLVVLREFIRNTLVNRNVEKPITQATTGSYSGEQGITTRVVNAPQQPMATPFFNAPDISPELLAPSIGRPPIPKGGFGTKVVTRRER